MRVCHYIKPNHKAETPSYGAWLSLDIQPIGTVDGVTQYGWSEGTLILGRRNQKTGIWLCQESTITNADAIWGSLAYLGKERTKRYLWIENSNFTLNLIDAFKLPMEYAWTMKTAVIQNPPTIVNYRRNTSTLTVLDISNFWPMPLSPTLTGPNGDPTKSESSDSAQLPKPTAHAERAKLMFRKTTDWWTFLHKNDLGGFSATAGAQSFRVWRHRYMTHKVLIDLHDDALKLARDGLFGGRVECFRIGKFEGEFHQFDITSSYAHSMSKMDVPTRLLWYSNHCDIQDLWNHYYQHVLIADVSMESKEERFPMRKSGMCVFPVGRFRTVLCGTELESALHQGLILKVYRASCYAAEPAFSQYMEALWKHRDFAKRAGDQDEVDRWKLLMNSFFGKWAQKGGHWEHYGPADSGDTRSWTVVDFDDKGVEYFRQFGGIVQKIDSEKEASQSSPAIAACVTAHARQRLWKEMLTCGLENIYYVDTDSILCNDVGYWRLLDSVSLSRFGGLRWVSSADSVQIYGAKDYRLGSTRRRSGAKLSGLYVNESTVHQTLRSSVSASIGRNAELGATEKTIEKTWGKAYAKGKVDKYGVVTPLEENYDD